MHGFSKWCTVWGYPSKGLLSWDSLTDFPRLFGRTPSAKDRGHGCGKAKRGYGSDRYGYRAAKLPVELDLLERRLVESRTTVIIPFDDGVIFVGALNCAEFAGRFAEVAQTLDAISGT
jgi:hypothetical protein